MKLDKSVADERLAKQIKAEIDGALDEICTSESNPKIKLSLLVSKAQNKQVLIKVQQFIQKKLSEFCEVRDTDDEQLKEGYSNFGKRKLNRVIDFLSEGLQVVKVRKNAAKKVTKAPVKVVSRVKYKEEDEKLDVVSVPPSKVVGCTEVVLFNTKYRRLAVIRAQKGSSLTILGTSVRNFDPENSLVRSVKNPEDIIPVCFYKQDKKVIAEMFDSLKTVVTKANGRINKDTLILSVN